MIRTMSRKRYIATALLLAWPLLQSAPVAAQNAAKENATMIVTIRDKPSGVPARVETLHVRHLRTGKVYELRQANEGQWTGQNVLPGAYFVLFRGRCGSCKTPREVSAREFVAAATGKTTTISFFVDQLPGVRERAAVKSLYWPSRRCEVIDTSKRRALEIVRNADAQTLSGIRKIWPGFLRKLRAGLSEGQRRKVNLAFKVTSPTARRERIKALFPNASGSNAISGLKSLLKIWGDTLELNEKNVALAKSLLRDFKYRYVPAKTSVGKPMHTAIQVNKGDCVTIIAENQTWSARQTQKVCKAVWRIWGGNVVLSGPLGRNFKGKFATYRGGSAALYGTLKGRIFSGKWVQNNSAEKCRTEEKGSHFWGGVELTFLQKSVSGTWGYCNNKQTGKANGTLVQSCQKPIKDRFSALGSSRFDPVDVSGTKFPFGALAGRIGPKGRNFMIGTGYSGVAKKSGKLQLYFVRRRSPDIAVNGQIVAKIQVRRMDSRGRR